MTDNTSMLALSCLFCFGGVFFLGGEGWNIWICGWGGGVWEGFVGLGDLGDFGGVFPVDMPYILICLNFVHVAHLSIRIRTSFVYCVHLILPHCILVIFYYIVYLSSHQCKKVV